MYERAEIDSKSGANGVHSNSVAVGISEADLSARGAFFIHGHTELSGDRVEVAHMEMDERVRPGVACVFGQEESDSASDH
jgi:hypothetical protein